MSAFIAGVIFGALLIGSVIMLFISRSRAPRREPVEWQEDYFEDEPKPLVQTKIKSNKREYIL